MWEQGCAFGGEGARSGNATSSSYTRLKRAVLLLNARLPLLS